MKKLLLVLLLAVSLTACEKQSIRGNSDTRQQKQTEMALEEADRQVGMPAIKNFQQRRRLKEIYEMLDKENIITYCYLMNERTGSIGQFLGKGIGYGIPAATQFTNPVKYTDRSDPSGGDYGVFLPQADPNGLFNPTSTSATYYTLLDKDNKPRVLYIEPAIIVSPIKLH